MSELAMAYRPERHQEERGCEGEMSKAITIDRG